MSQERPRFGQKLTNEIGEILEAQGFVDDPDSLVFVMKEAVQSMTITFIRERSKFSQTMAGILDSTIFWSSLVGGNLGLGWIWYMHNNPGTGDFAGGFTGGLLLGISVGRYYPEVKDCVNGAIRSAMRVLGFRD